MIRSCENELKKLQLWIDNTNALLMTGTLPPISFFTVTKICNDIAILAEKIAEEYSFYATELMNISSNLFTQNQFGQCVVNTTAFGGLVVIIRHISQEPVDTSIWSSIHPRIQRISKGLYCDGYYDSAAEKAVKELETRLRELFKELRRDDNVPAKVGDIIGALLSENGAYHFVDTSTVSGKDYRRGIQNLFEGIFAAYRNPSSHENLPCSKREALEQIMLASQLMFVLAG